jgi:cysteine desulfurase
MPAYLDHAATTPLCEPARRAALAWSGERFGNPSGPHSVAAAARAALDDAREVVSTVLGTAPGDVVFTSGGTESDNLAVLGRALAAPGAVVVSAVEHHAVLRAAQAAGRWAGCPVRTVGTDADGRVDLAQLADALDRSVSIVSVQLVNNEVGTLQPFAEVARLVRRRAPQAVLHTDAVQAAPWYDLAEMAQGADLVTISAHKFGGPQGAGVLAFARPVELAPLSFGGPQERGRRAGTQDVAGAAGLGAALSWLRRDREAESERVTALRDRLALGLLAALEGVRLTAGDVPRAPGHCHLVVEGVDSEELLFLLDSYGVCASAGSACASGALEASHVLTAMGTPPALARGALRLSLGHSSTDADVDMALEAVPRAVSRLREAVAPGALPVRKVLR